MDLISNQRRSEQRTEKSSVIRFFVRSMPVWWATFMCPSPAVDFMDVFFHPMGLD